MAGTKPCFLILKDSTNFVEEARALESQGVLVRQRVPPFILITDVPETLNLAILASLKEHHFGPVAIETLEALGPAAVAAALKWNRSLLNRPPRPDLGSQSALRSLSAQRSLPAPDDFQAREENGVLQCQWKPTAGAILYRVQASLDNDFSKPYCDTRTNHPWVALPLPQTDKSATVWIRVQGVDYPEQNQEELYGPWAHAALNAVTALPIDESLPTLMLTSPVNKFKSEGSNVVLEWKDGPDGPVRLQISTSDRFETTVVDQMAAGGEFVCPAPTLKVGQKYFWRARTYGPRQSPWSKARRFEIGEPHHAQRDMFVNPEAPR